MNKDIKALLKDAAILLAITLVAGLMLGFVYEITKGPIAEQQDSVAKAAAKEVFADAADISLPTEVTEAYSFTDDANGISDGNVVIESYREAKDASDAVIGYVVTVNSHNGFGGDIRLSIGVRNDGTINGISILEIAETAGLGMNAETDLKPQFVNVKADRYDYTKTGEEGKINAISGATVTTKAVLGGINAGVDYVKNVLEGGAFNG